MKHVVKVLGGRHVASIGGLALLDHHGGAHVVGSVGIKRR